MRPRISRSLRSVVTTASQETGAWSAPSSLINGLHGYTDQLNDSGVPVNSEGPEDPLYRSLFLDGPISSEKIAELYTGFTHV